MYFIACCSLDYYRTLLCMLHVVYSGTKPECSNFFFSNLILQRKKMSYS